MAEDGDDYHQQLEFGDFVAAVAGRNAGGDSGTSAAGSSPGDDGRRLGAPDDEGVKVAYGSARGHAVADAAAAYRGQCACEVSKRQQQCGDAKADADYCEVRAEESFDLVLEHMLMMPTGMHDTSILHTSEVFLSRRRVKNERHIPLIRRQI